MNNPTKIAAIALASTTLYTTYQVHRINKDMVNRFPILEPKLVKKVYWNVMADALRGRLDHDLESKTDEEMDVIFMEYFNKYAKK